MIHDTYEKWTIIFLLNPNMISYTFTLFIFSLFFLTEALVSSNLIAQTLLHTYDQACHPSPMFYTTIELENAFSQF